MDSSPLLELVQTLDNFQGMVDCKYHDLIGDGIGQIYCLTSGVNGSRLLKLERGIKLEKLAESVLPVQANKIWCIKFIGKTIDCDSDLIILRLQESILLLQTGG